MADYFQKARELGQLILESEQSIRLADARAAFLEDAPSVEAMNEYNAYQRNIQQSMEQGVMTKEQFADATKRLTEMGAELKSQPIIGEFVKMENEFNFFVNQVMGVLKSTIMGTTEENGCGGSCGGSCGGCGHN